MRLKFLHNIGFVLLVNLTVKPFWIFAIDRQVQNLAGPEVYGSYYALLNFSLLLSALLDVGISNYNARRVAIQREAGMSDLPQLLGMKSLLFGLYLLFNLGAASFLNYPPIALWWLLLISINQGLHFLNTYLRSNLAGLQLFKLDGLVGVLDKLLMSLGALPLILGHSYGSGHLITDFILVQMAAYLLSSSFLLLLLGRKTPIGLRIEPKAQWHLLKQTLPFATLGILMGLYTKIDAVMLEALLPNGAYAAGIYAAAYRLLDAMAMVPILMSGVLLPQFSSLLAKRELTPSFARTAALLLGGIGFLSALVLLLHGDFLLAALYTHNSPTQTRVFQWLMLSFIPLSLNYVFGTLLTAAGSMKLMNLLALGGLGINLLLNAWLIPQAGAIGAAIATLSTQIFILVGQYLSCHQRFQWRTDLRFVFRIAAFLLLSLGMAYYLPFPKSLWSLALCGLLGVAMLLLFFGQPIYQRLKAQFERHF
ncbi:MAG: polysaccharide biosynthesis C-terminal domain-containing protein [Sphingobacteriaceae bacterium]|nr:polysaccharide biosynthesis C-terminal domain-containing protein [Sphingobacteriaceae bacterium]